MKNLTRDNHYNRLKEVIKNKKNQEKHFNALSKMVKTFSKRFDSEAMKDNLNRLIRLERKRNKMGILLNFIERIES